MEQEQRVRMQQQRVIDKTPILTIPRIMNAPPILQSRNPTTKLALKDTPHLHWRVTQNNTPGAVPAIARVPVIAPTTRICPEWRGETNVGWREETQCVRRRSPRGQAIPPPTTFTANPSGARHRMVTRQAINVLTIQEEVAANNEFTPKCLMKHMKKSVPLMFEHFASPMVHPIMGKTISSYKKLMNDPATQPKCGRLHLARIFGGWHKCIQKWDKKVQTQCLS